MRDAMTDVTTQNSDLSNKAGNLKDRLSDTGDEFRRRASEAFNASSEVARDKLGQFADGAKDVASHAADRVSEQVGAQQSAGADYLNRFADNIRNSAKAFEHDAPFAAKDIDVAVDFIKDTAEKVRSVSVQDLIDGATSFARRQPAAFLG